jgi:flagellar hook-associated protein 3 FlgL
MLHSQLLRNLANNMKRMDGLQLQMATGRKINKPSDDPVGVTYSLRYRSDLEANDQFQRNLSSLNTYLEYMDSLLNQAGEVIHRLRELSTQAANGTNPQAAMDSIKSEVLELKAQMIDIANSQLNNKYLFNGQKTDVRPYPDEANAANAITDPYEIYFEVGAGVQIPTNVSGNEIFGYPTEADNIFRIFDDVIQALDSSDFGTISESLGRMNTRMDKLLAIRSEVGARTNRSELMESRLLDMEVNITSLLSRTEDADLAELIMKLKLDENVYQASLSAGARVIRPSLVDFLN